MTDFGTCLSLEARSSWGYLSTVHSGSTPWWPAEEEEDTKSFDLDLQGAVL